MQMLNMQMMQRCIIYDINMQSLKESAVLTTVQDSLCYWIHIYTVKPRLMSAIHSKTSDDVSRGTFR